VATGAATIRILRQRTSVLAGIVVTRVAGCARASVLWPGVSNILIVLPVTPGACQIRVVITRIIGVGRVAVVNRRPAIGGMTGITIRRGNKMIPSLTGCCIAIVAGLAIAVNAGVIPGATDKRGRGMTEVAIQVGRDMLSTGLRQFGFHSDCVRTIVTIGTTIHYTGVIKRCRDKGRCAVTHTAILIGLHMIRSFTSSEHTVMTAAAVVYDTPVIKRSR
jgi:hypothetical protein